MHRPHSTTLFIAVLASSLLGVGCRRGDDARYDSALSRDLNLVRPSDSSLMIVSPEQRTRLEANRSRASSTGATGERVYRSSSGEVARSPARTEVVKHTKRDAAIGAAAGAIIGGATHGGKGAVVGGATGAVVGAIIGNNVDKTKKKKP